MLLIIMSMGICPGCPNCKPNVVADVTAELSLTLPEANREAGADFTPLSVEELTKYLHQPEGTPTAILPPKPELWVGNKVYSAVHGPTDLHGRIFGMSHSFYDVLWEDGFRGRYTRDELELVFPEGE